jgi:hypothetical protein
VSARGVKAHRQASHSAHEPSRTPHGSAATRAAAARPEHARAIERNNHLAIDAHTCEPGEGARMDLAYVIDVMLDITRAARAVA